MRYHAANRFQTHEENTTDAHGIDKLSVIPSGVIVMWAGLANLPAHNHSFTTGVESQTHSHSVTGGTAHNHSFTTGVESQTHNHSVTGGSHISLSHSRQCV